MIKKLQLRPRYVVICHQITYSDFSSSSLELLRDLGRRLSSPSGEEQETSVCADSMLQYNSFTDDILCYLIYKGKVLSYSLLSVGPGAYPSVVTHPLPPVVGCYYFSAVTFPDKERHHPLTNTNETNARRCEQLAQGCYAALSWWNVKQRPIDHKSNTAPPNLKNSTAIKLPNLASQEW